MSQSGLFYDPGAEYMGWAVLSGDGQTSPVYISSGVIKCPRRPNEEYQKYKLRLEEFWTFIGPTQLQKYQPNFLCNEIVPSTGFGNSVQSDLAKAAISVIHAMAFERDIPVYQISAATVKKAIGGKRDATKVQVRNGVISLMPELTSRKSEWTKRFDEPDALGVGLAKLGYTVSIHG